MRAVKPRPHPPRRTTAVTVTVTVTVTDTDTVVAVGVAVLVVIGFAASYDTLRTLAITDGGFPAWLAPAVPLSFDLGIVVLSLNGVTAARVRRLRRRRRCRRPRPPPHRRTIRGAGSALGLASHAQRLCQKLVDHPERFTAAAGINARRTGAPDPQLLALAGQVLTWLPLIATRSSEEQDRAFDPEHGPL